MDPAFQHRLAARRIRCVDAVVRRRCTLATPPLSLSGPARSSANRPATATPVDFFPTMTDLKLLALDADDLAVLSAHVQDAVLRLDEAVYDQKARRFVAVVNRFDWLGAGPEQPGTREAFQRRKSALRFDRVVRAQFQGLDPKAKRQVLSLLALRFDPAEAPGGHVVLLFAGGAAIRLQVECIEGEIRDLGAAWRARSKPRHPVDDEPTSQS